MGPVLLNSAATGLLIWTTGAAPGGRPEGSVRPTGGTPNLERTTSCETNSSKGRHRSLFSLGSSSPHSVISKGVLSVEGGLAGGDPSKPWGRRRPCAGVRRGRTSKWVCRRCGGPAVKRSIRTGGTGWTGGTGGPFQLIFLLLQSKLLVLLLKDPLTEPQTLDGRSRDEGD